MPNGWEVRTLQELTDIMSGGTPPTTVGKYWDGNIIWVVPTDITNQRKKHINTSERKITELGLANSAATLLPIGTILLCSRATIGELAIAAQPMATNQGFKNLVCYACAYNEFLYYALQLLKSKMLEQASGSTFLEISKTALGNIKVLTPPLPEQRAIAATLSDADAYIESLEKLIAKKRAVKMGVMGELLTGRRRLAGFGGEWDKVELGSVADIYRGGSPRPIQSYLTTEKDGINWIKIGDVSPSAKYINATEERIIPEGASCSRTVNKGDFILSNSMSFGRPYILNIDGCIHDGWLTIQNYQNSFDTDFLYYMLSSEDTLKQYVSMAAGSSVQNLNKEKVSKVCVYMPTLKEQSAIAKVLSDMDSEIEALTAKLTKLQTLKQGMMSALLTGQIRLVK